MSEKPTYRSERARRVHRNQIALLLAGVPIALAALVAFAGLVVGGADASGLGFFALPLVGLGLLGLGSTYSRRAYVDLRGDVVSVKDGTLSVDDRVVVSKDEIEQAFILPHEGAVWVEIERRGRVAVTVRVDDDADGRALLSALGFDATQAIASFRALTGFYMWPVKKQLWTTLVPFLGPLILGALLVMAAGPPAVPYAVATFLLGLGLFARLFVSARVTIGADGLRHKWRGEERFYAWQTVERVERWADPDERRPFIGLKLALKGGGEAIIGAGQEGLSADTAAQLLLRAQQSWAAQRESTESDHLPGLERGTRDGVTWVNHLRALGAGGGGHQRDNFVGPETLIRVVEDAAQPAVARASALVAARSQLSDDELARVRIVANTTADDPLRLAIDCALDPAADEGALAEALVALEPSAAQKP